MLTNKERTIGSTGLSVGTHLAMETLFKWLDPFDPEREKPTYINIGTYSCYYFNLYTLARNLANSFPKENDRVKIYADKEFPLLLGQEIMLLQDLFNQINSGLKLIIYKCDYSKAIKAYNKDKGDLDTATYIEFVMIDNRLNEIIHKDLIVRQNVVTSDYKLPKPPKGIIGTNFLITTSISFDLLNKGNLTLLESHTGKTKTKDKFYTKFHTIGKNDLSNIPYTEETLYVLGDKFLIRPLNLVIRKALMAKAFEGNWNYHTPTPIVRSQMISDPDFGQSVYNFKKIFI